MIYLTCVYEDDPTHLAMVKMLKQFPGCFFESVSIPCHGFGKIKKNIRAYNNAARYGCYFVITDLDRKYDCAPLLIDDWLPDQRNDQLIFRVAVREIESWFLADRKGFAAFFSVSRELIPPKPDAAADPKLTVISLARGSKKRSIREAVVPVDDYASIGPGYNLVFQDYIQNYWDIAAARQHSPSLDRALRALGRIAGSAFSSNTSGSVGNSPLLTDL
jgi:hypothetical protein